MLQADTEQLYKTWITAFQQGIGSAIQGNNNTINKSNVTSQASNTNLSVETKHFNQKARYKLILFFVEESVATSNFTHAYKFIFKF